MVSKLFALVVGFVALVTVMGCAGEDKVINQQTSGHFLQEFNPEFVDVLWVLDDRSTLYPVKNHLVTEAQKFFSKLESVRRSYRMAFITSDMQFAKGALKPKGNPIVLERHIGDTNSYVSFFGSIINQLFINLGTGAEPKGFEAAEIALTQNFIPRKGIPLVLIFVSDSEDLSDSKTAGKSAVDYYSERFLSLKENDPKFLRVYSFNYTETGDRCTGSVYNADIDKKKPDGTSAYEGKAFKLTQKLGGETGDICGNFADKISLEGLRLKVLPNRFKLDKQAKPESISVSLLLANGDVVSVAFHYEAASNEIVFDQTPPEGATIQVSYLPL